MTNKPTFGHHPLYLVGITFGFGLEYLDLVGIFGFGLNAEMSQEKHFYPHLSVIPEALRPNVAASCFLDEIQKSLLDPWLRTLWTSDDL